MRAPQIMPTSSDRFPDLSEVRGVGGEGYYCFCASFILGWIGRLWVTMKGVLPLGNKQKTRESDVRRYRYLQKETS
jgi:hypothetical protein